jgi:hypothetical protein
MNCNRPHTARGLCQLHYRRWARCQPKPRCGVAGCTSDAKSSGIRSEIPMCTRHYTRWIRYGDTHTCKRNPLGDRCSVPYCGLPPISKGLCNRHYTRVKKYGDPHHLEYAPRGSGTTNKKGYRAVFVDGKSRQEHRVIVERFLNRPLLKTENVHHRNGIRSENTVGDCVLHARCECPNERHNLELWSTAQPSGKRIADLVRFAHEILRQYQGD